MVMGQDKSKTMYCCETYGEVVSIRTGFNLVAGAKVYNCVLEDFMSMLKVHKYNLFKYFFAETESLWSQGAVTRDF